MRLFRLLAFLSLLFGASASSLDSRRPDAHPLDARDLPNVCATLTSEDTTAYPSLHSTMGLFGLSSQFNGPLSPSFQTSLIMLTGVCLCQSDVFPFLDEDFGEAFQNTISPSDLSNLVRKKGHGSLNFPHRVSI